MTGSNGDGRRVRFARITDRPSARPVPATGLARPPRPTPAVVRRPPPPAVLGAERLDPAKAGGRWWMYRRPEPAGRPSDGTEAGNDDRHPPAAGGALPPPPANGAASAGRPEDHGGGDRPVTLVASDEPPYLMVAVLGGVFILAAAIVARFEIFSAGKYLVPFGALLLAAAFSRYARAAHPDEPWLGRIVWLGVLAKLAASYFRWLSIQIDLEKAADSTMYSQFGTELATAWFNGTTEPELTNLQQTNFLRWFTGVVYYVFGIDFLTGYLVFGLIAVVGSYLWYRATVDAVPFIDKRLYLVIVMFAPSIVFWPSTIGKEALMQLGIGVMALGTARLMQARLLRGLMISAAGGWLLWVVRPHLLAMVSVAAGLAYMFGRVKRGEGRSKSLLSRPIGIIAVALLVVFTITQGANFLGIESFSLSSVEDELNEQTERSTRGGSSFDNGGNSLNPLYLPQGAATVLLRPFPWETETGFQRLASIESVIVAMFLLARFGSLRIAVAQSRRYPFLAYCLILTLMYSEAFASFANFGLLVRQRSLVLPALYVLASIDTRAFRAMSGRSPDDAGALAPVGRSNGVASGPAVVVR